MYMPCWAEFFNQLKLFHSSPGGVFFITLYYSIKEIFIYVFLKLENKHVKQDV